MKEFNPIVPASKTLHDLAASSDLQSREPANPQRVGGDKVAEPERVERTISEQLRQANEELAQSEERFRVLFDEAPIAYVYGDNDTRIVQANSAAMKMFGLKPEEIPGVFGTSLVPDTADAQRRLRDGRELIRRGIYPKGLVLELRPMDDGRPLWVEWWYSPMPGGKLVSSMLSTSRTGS
jgi:PAS domain S-box-containing protein